MTCKLPGAKVIKKLKSDLHKAKGSKPVPRRGQLVRKRPASYRELLKKRGHEYTGKGQKIKAKAKARALFAVRPAMPKNELEAYEALVNAGYLNKIPRKCPTCKCGDLGDIKMCQRQGLTARCDLRGCQASHPVIKFSNLKSLGEVARPGRSFDCMSLYTSINNYSNPVCGTAARAVNVGNIVGSGSKPLCRLFDELRDLEAKAAHLENKTICLAGPIDSQRNVEGDGTVLRKIWVSKQNPHFQEEIAYAEKRLKRRGKFPRGGIPLWNAHIRYAALSERGGRITIARLPVRMVAPGGPPPPEAFEELRQSGLMKRCAKSAFIFTDGAHSWPKLIKHHNRLTKSRMRLEEVVHYKGQYTRTVRNPVRGQSSIAGTQSLDQRWRWMKTYVPFNLKARSGRTVNPRLDTYVFSYQFRVNTKVAGESVFTKLGGIVRKRKA